MVGPWFVCHVALHQPNDGGKSHYRSIAKSYVVFFFRRCVESKFEIWTPKQDGFLQKQRVLPKRVLPQGYPHEFGFCTTSRVDDLNISKHSTGYHMAYFNGSNWFVNTGWYWISLASFSVLLTQCFDIMFPLGFPTLGLAMYLWQIYHSYWTLPFIVDLPIKNCDFPQLC